jgi:hypothetical protein
MALSVVINATAKTQSDLELALEEALRNIRNGNISGFDRDGSGGSYNFDVEGEEELVTDED